MNYTLFNSTLENNFEFNEQLFKESGIYKSKEEVSFQPGGGLPKDTKQAGLPLDLTAQVMLRLISEIKHDGKTVIKWVSSSKCLLFFKQGDNEEKVFLEFINESIEAHKSNFNTKKQGTIFQANEPVDFDEAKKREICKSLISYFRALF